MDTASQRALLLLPGGIAETVDAEPVYYLISGTTDTEETFWKVGKVNLMLDNMIAAGTAKPMIVVMPYGNRWRKLPNKRAKTNPPM